MKNTLIITQLFEACGRAFVNWAKLRSTGSECDQSADSEERMQRAVIALDVFSELISRSTMETMADLLTEREMRLVRVSLGALQEEEGAAFLREKLDRDARSLISDFCKRFQVEQLLPGDSDTD